MFAGFLGGAWDTLIMRFVDVLLSIPLILMALLVVAILGPKITNIVLVMGGVGWIRHARIVRGNALRIREEQYVLAAVNVGTTRIGIMWRHVLPNLLAPVLVTATMQIGYMVILESGLSFFGITGTTLSWGWDISAGRKYLASAWWIASFPGWERQGERLGPGEEDTAWYVRAAVLRGCRAVNRPLRSLEGAVVEQRCFRWRPVPPNTSDTPEANSPWPSPGTGLA